MAPLKLPLSPVIFSQAGHARSYREETSLEHSTTGSPPEVTGPHFALPRPSSSFDRMADCWMIGSGSADTVGGIRESALDVTTTRNLRTVNSSTSNAPKRAFLISRRPTKRRPIATAPTATAPSAAAPAASANRLAVETALDCPVVSRLIRDLCQPSQPPPLFATDLIRSPHRRGQARLVTVSPMSIRNRLAVAASSPQPRLRPCGSRPARGWR
jgi:hypothetical protein